jgi:two-component system osmolarity sensor histidine kinase EnvZ
MGLRRSIKRRLPAALFARGLLILFLPLLLIQLLSIYIFYERHWDSVVRNLSEATAADVAMLVQEHARVSKRDGATAGLAHITHLASQIGMQLHFSVGETLSNSTADYPIYYPEFYRKLERRIAQSFYINTDQEDRVHVVIQVPSGILDLHFSHKRLASTTTYLFVMWVIGSTLLFGVIASLFLRNQVRPVVQLARAAEQFGTGQEVEGFSPRGASEVRRAGRAFLTMADRIRRQMQTRTDMLSGISHDLRTPLTRMRLAIEMSAMGDKPREALLADIEEMQSMIDAYLAFARGDEDTPPVTSDVGALLARITEGYVRQKKAVSLHVPEQEIFWHGRPQALRRCVQNLVDNALRYGKRADISLMALPNQLRITIADTGPGIPKQDHETAFKPFRRMEHSRNSKTGGVGLGLSIARDIAQAHGGNIVLENITDADGAVNGLRAEIRLPLTKPAAESC